MTSNGPLGPIAYPTDGEQGRFARRSNSERLKQRCGAMAEVLPDGGYYRQLGGELFPKTCFKFVQR